jgi:hypothetical protein
MEAKKVQMVCSSCKSEDVVKDAFARWDPEMQAWVLSAVYDHTQCNACGSETLAEKPYEPPASEYPREDKCRSCGAHVGWVMREEGDAMALDECEHCKDYGGERTVLAQWGLRCPQCKRDDSIDIQMRLFGRLYPDGTDDFEPGDGPPEWDKNSLAVCAACQFAGMVSDFEANEKGAGHEHEV